MEDQHQPGLPEKEPQDEKKRQSEDRKQNILRVISFIIGLALLVVLIQEYFLTPFRAQSAVEIPYSEFKQMLAEGKILNARIGLAEIVGEMKNPETEDEQTNKLFKTPFIPSSDPSLLQDLEATGIKYSFQRQPIFTGNTIIAIVIIGALIFAMWYFGLRKSGGIPTGRMTNLLSHTKSKAQEVKKEEIGITFKDVGGADEVIAELQEIIQFLKAPEKFARLGGRIPKGVLLVGPPGTGKTLLAKACAGEAQVPFFEASGSEFVEMYVGVGAARVRSLFEQARAVAPAIVFIDEIDAIGQSRGAGPIRQGSNDEREQTLNQLLAEIDGFKTNTNAPVIIMAACNRPEVLDQALMRAGRFDRQIIVSNPDLIGRKQILKIHSREVKLAEDFDVERAARITSGFSGADLENVMNEAALLAARRDADAVAVEDFEAAIERVIAGLEKRTRVMSDETKTAVAYHEIGHAMVAELVQYGDPVSKISIVPRTRGALGYTLQLPAEDRFLLTVEELRDRIAVMMAGRAAEKLIFSTFSTGASDDIMRATDLARRMVAEFGMSEKLGSVRYASQGLQFLGGAGLDFSNISPKTAELIDSEVQRIINEEYERAQRLLRRHRAVLENLTRQLLEQETLDGCEVSKQLNGSSRSKRPSNDQCEELAGKPGFENSG